MSAGNRGSGQLTNLDVVLAALAILETSLQARDRQEAIDDVRADLEVLDRATLVSIATAVAVESTWAISPTSVRRQLLGWVRRRQMLMMVHGR